ncbi:MAG: HIT domain-containing protein [Halobacteriales archaeon]
MSEDCLFCKIARGDLPARKVYEDDDVVAFLDVNPLSRGHTLVIPREHAERLDDMSSDAAWTKALEIAPAVQEAVDADALNVGVNDGSEAGQEVPHVHVHVVPRYEGDGGGPIHALMPEPAGLDDDEMDEIEDAVRSRLG